MSRKDEDAAELALEDALFWFDMEGIPKGIRYLDLMAYRTNSPKPTAGRYFSQVDSGPWSPNCNETFPTLSSTELFANDLLLLSV
jgi:hypothetical protein